MMLSSKHSHQNISGIRWIKRFLIGTRIGRFLDILVRGTLLSIPFVHSIVSQKKDIAKPDGFVIFLYGGVGDIVLTLQLMQKLSSVSKLYIICDDKTKSMAFLFPKQSAIISYEKGHFIRDIIAARECIKQLELVFIQISPIIELYIVRLLLGIPRALGLIVSYREIRSIGHFLNPVKINQKARLLAYEAIGDAAEAICQRRLFGDCNNIDHCLSESTFGGDTRCHQEDSYVVLAPLKSVQWHMGKMSDQQYVRLSEHLVMRYGVKVYLVGDASESEGLQRMVEASSCGDMLVNMAGRTSLHELAMLLLKARFVIANDNGVAHLSSYLGIRTLVLFMFSDPEVYKWSGCNYAYLFNRKFSCMPCVSVNRFPRDNYPVMCRNSLGCNNTISADSVLDFLVRLKWD